MTNIFMAAASSHAIARIVFDQGQQPEAWYKVVAGIIAIPAGVLGLLVTYNILRKTTLESRKLELELQASISGSAATVERPSSDLLGLPIVQVQRALLLVVRFVVLELTLRLWNIIPSTVGYLTAGVSYGFLFANPERIAGSQRFAVVLTAIPAAIRFGFDIVYWLMVFGFGWPLLKDTCGLLGIEVRSLWDLLGIRHWLRKPAR
jgi:hypothetical protein